MGFEKQSKLLRSFHNKVKNFLITAYASNLPILLDIGVGRGGDVFKWIRANIAKCYAYDIDDVSIQEAKRRLSQSNEDLNGFECHLMTLPNLLQFKQRLDAEFEITQSNAISCQFAIHYFFKTEAMAHELMTFVSEMLIDGGYFFGTFMQGDVIMKLTKDLTETFSNTQMMIHPKDPSPKDFGTPIDVFLTNTLYFGDKSVSSEYLVMNQTLIKIAQEHGLKLIELTPFEEHYTNFNIQLQDDVKTCSFAYASFVFQKMTFKE